MYKVFEKLLKSHNITAYRVAKDTGISTATLTQWKNGTSTPKSDKLQKIADYFDVTLDYLTTGKETASRDHYYINNETVKVAQEIFENKELRMLFDAARDSDPQDLIALHNMALALKRKERGNNEEGC